jgi:uncharacterized membrane protein YfcA
MDYFVICLVALAGSALTFFSGFGLGTLLLPVFAIFFPLDLSVALTAIVHFLNNLFKLALVGRKADKKTVLAFGLPSVLAAFAGALLLAGLSKAEPLYSYQLSEKVFYVTPLKLSIATVLFFFSLFDTVPRLAAIQFPARYLFVGGLLSGFFGGLSGNQGALRSAFLIRANLTKETYIATGVVIACLVDITRLSVYSGQILQFGDKIQARLVIAATLSAFVGAFIGNRMLKKITIRALQLVVTVMLLVFSLLLAAGII